MTAGSEPDQTAGVRILVTNDDGIDSPGLHALAQRMAALGEVIGFAPTSEHSGAGAAIGHLSEGVPEVDLSADVDTGAVMAGFASVTELHLIGVGLQL